MFVKSVSDDMLNIAKMFEPEAVTFLSYNNKARIPLGLAAATLQAPILMHLEYKIKLPDHSFVVTPARQLIPSVYGVCEITSKGRCLIQQTTLKKSGVQNIIHPIPSFIPMT